MRRLRTAAPVRLTLAWLPAVAWAGVIFALSATPNLRVAESEVVDLIVRKAGHMAEFGTLALLAWRAFAYSRLRGAVVLSLALTAAYAGSDEFHQSFIAGRTASPVDVGIDSAGALIALLALVAWLRFRARGRPVA
ncbi:MAG: VanZ family protein [Candidatus Limnocylindrales bacterium]